MSGAAVRWTTDSGQRRRLGRRAQLLAAASVGYNLLEAVVAIGAGLAAGSVALVGFGLDSAVEVSSGLIILWQFRRRMPELREHQALRMLAVSFFALAAYVSVESLRALVAGSDPDPSPVGIGLATASLLVMPVLSRAQRRTGRELGSNAVVADGGTQTLLCTYLSAVLLVGLVLNATLGWSWADPVAGVVIAAVAGREGIRRGAARAAAAQDRPRCPLSRLARPMGVGAATTNHATPAAATPVRGTDDTPTFHQRSRSDPRRATHTYRDLLTVADPVPAT